eukprot:gene3272-2254_t
MLLAFQVCVRGRVRAYVFQVPLGLILDGLLTADYQVVVAQELVFTCELCFGCCIWSVFVHTVMTLRVDDLIYVGFCVESLLLCIIVTFVITLLTVLALWFMIVMILLKLRGVVVCLFDIAFIIVYVFNSSVDADVDLVVCLYLRFNLYAGLSVAAGLIVVGLCWVVISSFIVLEIWKWLLMGELVIYLVLVCLRATMFVAFTLIGCDYVTGLLLLEDGGGLRLALRVVTEDAECGFRVSWFSWVIIIWILYLLSMRSWFGGGTFVCWELALRICFEVLDLLVVFLNVLRFCMQVFRFHGYYLFTLGYVVLGVGLVVYWLLCYFASALCCHFKSACAALTVDYLHVLGWALGMGVGMLFEFAGAAILLGWVFLVMVALCQVFGGAGVLLLQNALLTFTARVPHGYLVCRYVPCICGWIWRHCCLVYLVWLDSGLQFSGWTVIAFLVFWDLMSMLRGVFIDAYGLVVYMTIILELAFLEGFWFTFLITVLHFGRDLLNLRYMLAVLVCVGWLCLLLRFGAPVYVSFLGFWRCGVDLSGDLSCLLSLLYCADLMCGRLWLVLLGSGHGWLNVWGFMVALCWFGYFGVAELIYLGVYLASALILMYWFDVWVFMRGTTGTSPGRYLMCYLKLGHIRWSGVPTALSLGCVAVGLVACWLTEFEMQRGSCNTFDLWVDAAGTGELLVGWVLYLCYDLSYADLGFVYVCKVAPEQAGYEVCMLWMVLLGLGAGYDFVGYVVIKIMFGSVWHCCWGLELIWCDTMRVVRRSLVGFTGGGYNL